MIRIQRYGIKTRQLKSGKGCSFFMAKNRNGQYVLFEDFVKIMAKEIKNASRNKQLSEQASSILEIQNGISTRYYDGGDREED